MPEGVDYSRAANANWIGLAAALKAQGKQFVGRYVVNDKSPTGRGIGPEEYKAMMAAGLNVFVYWESSEGWMTGGLTAGISAAQNAQQNILSSGLPPEIPVYFACDFDASPGDQDQIDECLRGCARVLGGDRIGIYGGFHVVERCHQNGTAKWFCQTLAWSGGQVFSGNHLFQYDTSGNFIFGTDLDLVRSLQPHYGGARDYLVHPESEYATPSKISWRKGQTGIFDQNGTPAFAFMFEVYALRKNTPVENSSPHAKPTGPVIQPHETKLAIGSYRAGANRNGFLVLEDGSRVKRSDYRPLLPLPKDT